MTEAWALFKKEFFGFAHHFWASLYHWSWHNFLFWFVGISLLCWLWETFRPWLSQSSTRRDGAKIDFFYLFFNFVLFPLLGFYALWSVLEYGVMQGFKSLGFDLAALQPLSALPTSLQLLVLFVVRDFVHWNIHRLLHRLPRLWRFHEIHHSATTLGVATHFRFHPMESVMYRSLEFLPLLVLGARAVDMSAVYIVSLAIGHLNHSNVQLPLGPLKYLFNNPQMHRWHHAITLPKEHSYGVNFGLSLSVWDYVFGTAFVPGSAESEAIGLKHRDVGESFGSQMLYPFRETK